MNEYSLLNVFQEIYKWKKHIIISVLIVGIITTIICLFLPNYYKASTTFYAASPTLANPTALGYDDNIRYIYGGSEDLDRLFSIVNSNELQSYLIKKFDLFKRYEVDSTTSEGRHLMGLMFKENYKTLSTKYEAIELSVEDKDPIIAAQIANEARNYANMISQRLIKETQVTNIKSVEKNITLQEAKVSALADTIQLKKSKSKVIDPYFQSETYSTEVIRAEGNLADAKAKGDFYSKYDSKKDSTIKYRAIASGLENKLRQLRSDLTTFYEVGPWLKKKETEYTRASDQLSIEKEKLNLIQSTYNSDFAGLHVIDKAYPPERKSRPKRSLIILGAMLLTFLAASLGVLLINSLKK